MTKRNGKRTAIVVGSGPNGLAAAIRLAQEGWSVSVFEAKETPGGGLRTAELTLPGFRHDICATIHTTGFTSPFLSTLPLEQYGVEWVFPPAALAHPFDDHPAAMVYRSLERTASELDGDARAYKRLYTPILEHWDKISENILGPLPLPPRHILPLLRFGWYAIRSSQSLARSVFRMGRARGLFAGMSAHSILPLDRPSSAAFGLILSAMGHRSGWPFARGGSVNFANALINYFRSLGGELHTAQEVRSLKQLPEADAVLFDVTPMRVMEIIGDDFPAGYRRSLGRYRYGPGVFKMDFALSAPVPWKDTRCAQAGTVHLGGSLEEITNGERDVWSGKHQEKPFVLAVQTSLFDDSRAPDGQHTLWAYCHVPNGSTVDMSRQIEGQIERFAPGFKDVILARHTFNASQMQAYNPNYVGGDINSGVQDLFQLFTRPVISLKPYRTALKGIYLCSSSTPPGGGTHGMCGYHAAETVLSDYA